MARVSVYAIASLLAVASSGCFDFSGNGAPLMSVELCWDEQPGAGFVGGNCANSTGQQGTCESAGVTQMMWTLTRADNGKQVAESAGTSTKCKSGMDIVDPAPGRYTLSISGTDKDGNMLWKSSCKNLDVLRFDIAYECNVDAPLSAPASPTPATSTSP
jgi:hypothetical protein